MHKMDPAAKLEHEKQLLELCKVKEHGTDGDVELMKARGVPTSATGKCVLACVQETIGVVGGSENRSSLHLASLRALPVWNDTGGERDFVGQRNDVYSENGSWIG